MNEIRQRGPIARFFVGLWDAMNFTRRLVFNLLFFGLLLIVLAAIASGDTAKPLLDRTTLVIAPEGKLVEQYSTDAASRALAKMFGDDGKGGEVQLRDLLHAIDEAKDDKRIERVLLRVDRMSFSGYASIREVAAALASCAHRASRSSPLVKVSTRASTCSRRRPTRSTSTRWAACCSKASAAIASTTAKACRTSSASTCTCSASANTSPPPSPTSSMLLRRNPRKPTCSG